MEGAGRLIPLLPPRVPTQHIAYLSWLFGFTLSPRFIIFGLLFVSLSVGLGLNLGRGLDGKWAKFVSFSNRQK